MVARASFLAVQRCVPLSKTRYSRLEEWPGILERIRGFPQRGCFPNGYFVHLSGRRKPHLLTMDDDIEKGCARRSATLWTGPFVPNNLHGIDAAERGTAERRTCLD